MKWAIDVSQPDVYELAVLGGGHGPSGALPVVEIAIGESVTTTELCESVFSYNKQPNKTMRVNNVEKNREDVFAFHVQRTPNDNNNDRKQRENGDDQEDPVSPPTL